MIRDEPRSGSDHAIPRTQHAIQFTGAGRIAVNTAKPVEEVGPTQMLLKVEACGICFSDTKLLRAFENHPRKSVVVDGLTEDDLAGIPSYHPGPEPITPGHEPVGRIVVVGDEVEHFAVGDRVLVQADWKHIRTASSNAAFGYTFDGALQEYVLIDERCVVTPAGEQFLLRVDEGTSAAAVGLVEPWATVEGSYAYAERNHPAPGGRMLVVGKGDVDALIAGHEPSTVLRLDSVQGLEGVFDDIVYFGADAATVEHLLDVLAAEGVLCIVLDGKRLDRDVAVDIGRIHYDFIRICGTTGDDAADGYAWIPPNGEVRDRDDILIVGAGGPMGTMHTIRNVAMEREGLRVTASDTGPERLAGVRRLAGPAADARGVELGFVDTDVEELRQGHTYIACMRSAPSFIAELIRIAGPDSLFNAFAGTPVGNPHPIDLQHVIEDRVFLFGTSGSDLADMRTVLTKIEAGVIDTHVSLDAIAGIAGFEDAIEAVQRRTAGGKIMVFPSLHDLPYLRLAELQEHLPHVAKHLVDGVWTKEAEDELLGR